MRGRLLLRRLLREAAWTVSLLAGTSVLVFLIVRAAPGDPARALGLDADAAGGPCASLAAAAGGARPVASGLTARPGRPPGRSGTASAPGRRAGTAGAVADGGSVWSPAALGSSDHGRETGAVAGRGSAPPADREEGGRLSPCRRGFFAAYAAWVAAAARGDFGRSFRTGRPVAEEIRRVGPNTLALAAGALAVTLAVAVPVGVAGALFRGSPLAAAATIAAYALSALPAFFAGYAAIHLFTRQLGLFPLAFGGDGRLPWLAFVLPMLVLGVANGGVGEVIRHVRAALERVLAEEYVRTARAKGAAVWRHAAAEGLLVPVVASLAAKVPFVLGGAVVVEQVFNWPGLGRLAWQAALDRDYPVILGLALLAAAVARGAALLAALAQAVLAPGWAVSEAAAPGALR